LIFFLGCSSDEYQQAEKNYLDAKSSHHINQLVTSLTVLVKLAPEQYSPLLFKAKQAKIKLLESKEYIHQKNYYLAYITSHDSLNYTHTIESKEILIESGSVFLPLFKAKKYLEKSYQPLDLTPLSQYKALPILDWNLIELNKLLNKLSENIQSLEKAMSIIKTTNIPTIDSLYSDLMLLETRIKNQLQLFEKAQDYLIDLALYHNATLLINLNRKLSDENITISQIFNKNKTNIAMRPFAEKAKALYAANKNVIENMFFSASSKTKKRHQLWYEIWKKLENDILDPKDGFVDYSHNTKHRNERLALYVNDVKIQLPTIEENNMINSIDFFQDNKTISTLIEKLKKDRRYFNS
jgi:hypothetical protein